MRHLLDCNPKGQNREVHGSKWIISYMLGHKLLAAIQMIAKNVLNGHDDNDSSRTINLNQMIFPIMQEPRHILCS